MTPEAAAKDKIVDKLQKIKRHADSAKEIGSEQEAQAFADMLSKLLLDHKLEMSDLEFEKMEQEQPIERHTIDYEKYGIKDRGARSGWRERLASIIAQAHFCRILVHSGTSRITLVGRREDIAVAEYLFCTLQRAIKKIVGIEEAKYTQECHRMNIFVGRGFRGSFVQAFLMRLYERFADLRRNYGESTALVRINKAEKAVESFMKANFKDKARAISVSRSYHRKAVELGRAAADRVNIKSNAVATTDTKKELV